MFDFSKQVVVITGAAGNLGAAVARAVQATGARLALVDRKRDRLAEIFPDFVDNPDYFLANCADLTNAEDVGEAISKVAEHFSQLDVLVNAVGGFASGTPLHETPLDTWERMMGLNARSVFIASQAVIPHMLSKGRGKIINIAARPGLRGRAKMAAYSASKGAVMRLTESMSAELKQNGINVNCIVPGTIDTPANRKAIPDAESSNWVKPEALAEVILFLASEKASDIHGAAVPVYGKS